MLLLLMLLFMLLLLLLLSICSVVAVTALDPENDRLLIAGTETEIIKLEEIRD